jgi:4-hydroxybenzoate polyprenyltransferase
MEIWQNIRKRKTLLIIEQSFTPVSIFAPIPFFCITLFFISTKFSELSIDKMYILFLGILISLLSSGATCFWNHTNDLKEDAKNNKKTLMSENIVSHREAIIISLFLYLISIILVIYASNLLNRPIYIYFIIWVIITWWYSDDIFLKKITGIRLKTHYFGELLTYGVAYPAYTMSIWLIFSDSFITGMVLSLIFLCFGISAVLLKDLKDIKGDREAGLKTFGVIFPPSKLIKISCRFLIFYFLLIVLAINFKIFNYNSFLIIVPFIYLLKNTFLHFQSKNWTIEFSDLNNIKAMMVSVYSSIFILGFANFI